MIEFNEIPCDDYVDMMGAGLAPARRSVA